MHGILKISFKIGVLAALVFCNSACSIFQAPKSTVTTRLQQKVYAAPFDRTWRAAQLALAQYPMRINNMEIGLIETEYIRGEKTWLPPGQKGDDGRRHQIRLQLIRGQADLDEATKVVVHKNIEFRKDFFSEVQKPKSDGLEEKVILYRIGRELLIEQALERSAQPSGNAPKSDDDSATN